jgi:shikimate kinase
MTAARRPDLTAAGGRDEIVQLLAVREPLYRATATITVDSGQRPVESIVDDVLRELPLSRGPSRASE